MDGASESALAPQGAAPPAEAWLSPSAALGRFQHPVGTTGTGRRTRPEAVRYGFRVGALSLLVKPGTGSEVIKLVPPSTVPNAPPWLLGLINLRSQLVPVFDLKLVCALPPEQSPAEPAILILDKGEDAVGLVIDGLPVALWGMEPVPHLPQLPTALRGHVAAGWTREAEVWLEFDHEGLCRALVEPGAAAIAAAPAPDRGSSVTD
jgi:twitching motility protein PilI